MKFIILILGIYISFPLIAQEAVLSENAPEDKPVAFNELQLFYEAQKPYNKQALDTYPDIKKRFFAGLPKGENLFLTTRLKDIEGRIEQVFVLVTSISESKVSGIIYNDIQLVSGFRNGQKYTFPESEIYDWLITKPDGSEEGNFVGKYIDSLQQE